MEKYTYKIQILYDDVLDTMTFRDILFVQLEYQLVSKVLNYKIYLTRKDNVLI